MQIQVQPKIPRGYAIHYQCFPWLKECQEGGAVELVIMSLKLTQELFF